MVLGFSEWNLEMVPNLEFFAGPYFRCLYILRESCKSVDFLYFAGIPGVFTIFLGFNMLGSAMLM